MNVSDHARFPPTLTGDSSLTPLPLHLSSSHCFSMCCTSPPPPPPYLYPLSSPHCFSMRCTKMSLSGRNGIGPHSVGPQLQGGREEGERAKGGGGLRGIGRASLDWPLVSLCRQSEKRGRQMLLLATHLSG